MAQFMHGEIKAEDLDDEELMRGQIKADNGTFSGRPPHLIPRAFHEALTRELLKRGEGILRRNFMMAMETFIVIAADPNVEPKDRLKAAQYIWERTAGKIPERMDIKAEIQPWQEDITEIISREE
jgi:acyl-CoA thioesterase